VLTYRVLVVEDDALAAEAHASYVARVPGFDVAGIARSGREALTLLQQAQVDLVLLDFHLPDGHGLEVLRRLRAAGSTSDVIAVTAAREVEVVKRAVAQGVLAYLLKPFTFAGFRAKLESYADYRRQLDQPRGRVGQAQVDEIIASRRGPGTTPELPKGLSEDTLNRIRSTVGQARAASAAQVAERTGTSRVTARRYLEFLVTTGEVRRKSRHGGTGRPEIDYVWES
jgi:response regulator of citrate/malate metabolism